MYIPSQGFIQDFLFGGRGEGGGEVQVDLTINTTISRGDLGHAPQDSQTRPILTKITTDEEALQFVVALYSALYLLPRTHARGVK